MRTFSTMLLPAAIGASMCLPVVTACSSGIPRGIPTGARALLATADSTPQPISSQQFPKVAAVDWTPDKPLVGGEIECEHGKVVIFDCENISLLAFLPESVLGGPKLTGIWGWTDPATGREFVLAGREGGTSFVEITDPVNPRYLGTLPFHAGSKPSIQRSIKVYKNHAFIVSDVWGGVSPHGIQVFDLTQLRDVKVVPATFQETARYDRLTSVHNIIVDTAAGFAYATSSGDDCGGPQGGGQIVDIRDPVRPAFAGCSVLKGHDAQCVIYHGPDQRYRGRQICLHADRGLGIVDVTDKVQPKLIGHATYPTLINPHQGWLSEDHRYFFFGDEGDEKAGSLTRTLVFDITDLSDPVVAKEFLSTTRVTDHNMFVRGQYLFQSNYWAGLRVLDISDPVNPKEVGYFDTTPGENTVEFGGSWGNYPYFKNGVIAVSTYDPAGTNAGRGLFILRYRPAARP